VPAGYTVELISEVGRGGTASENLTKTRRCRPDAYLGGYGWVPIDPADVRRVVLEEPPGVRPLNHEVVKKARTRLSGLGR